MAQILTIDDDKDILVLIKNVLQKDNHIVTMVTFAKELSFNHLAMYDLILLDVMMPDIDGFTLCKQIREMVDCPILFLTGKVMENDIMFGLGIGGDDYITKPFKAGELRARVNAHLRRDKRGQHNVLVFDELRFDLHSREIVTDQGKILLTKSEYDICEYLARNRGQVITKDKIYEAVFGYEGESDISVIPVHIKNIRAKISQYSLSPIETIWGVGYKWN